MLRTVLLTAALTGAFCSVFAVAVDLITDLFALWQLMLVSFVSGALGSLFAQTVMGRTRDRFGNGRDAG
jgi:hypothetical protein